LHSFDIELICLLAVIFLTAQAPTLAQSTPKDERPSDAALERIDADPPGLLYQGVPAAIPQDQGMAGLRLELLRLGTTGRRQ